MKYQIDKSSGVSAYMQLGATSCGGTLPAAASSTASASVKAAARGELGVSLITVEHAYALLVDEGYAEARAQRVLRGLRRQGGELRHPARCRCRTRQPCAYRRTSFSVLAKVMRRVLTEYDRRILMKPPGAGLCGAARGDSGVS